MIHIQNLYKSFGDTPVFSNFSATIPYHQITTINGFSGCGKTTLLRILAHLEVYDSGTIIGLDHLSVRMIFQENRLIEHLSIFTNIALPHLPHLPPHFDTQVRQTLSYLGLSIPLQAPVHTLSGGMKRRVALTRALLTDFDLLLLDEPFTGLDATTTHQVILYLQSILQNRTVVIVTHHTENLEPLNIQSVIQL